MTKVKFFRCPICGNIVMKIVDSGVVPFCCGKPMVELVANDTDAAVEKHVPVIDIKANVLTACIGATPHPMTQEHYIQWVYLETEKGGQIKYLSPNDEPKAEFALNGEKALCVYAYCNLHSLWKTELD